MLTRFVRTQLIIFTIASIIGVGVMVFAYMQVPTLLGVGRSPSRCNCPPPAACTSSATSPTGVYRSDRVTDVSLMPNGAQATLVARHLAEDPRRSQGRGAQRIRGR